MNIRAVVGVLGLILSIILLIITVVITVKRSGTMEELTMGYVTSIGFTIVSLMIIFY